MLANSDDRHKAAGGAAFFAIAEEEVAAAGGAQVTDCNVLRAQASFEELSAIGLAEVEENIFRRRLMAGRLHVEPLQWIGLVTSAQFIEPF